MIDIATPLNWGDLGVGELVPTGTVTLLLADVEGSTRLWQSRPDAMTAAFERLDRVLARVVDAHRGVRPVEQGEGDSFVVAFGRASDAVACALELQRAELDPIRMRIGIHTGEVQLRDEANYIGPTINRTGRLRDLAHGGQTVMSSTTADLVTDRLPADTWLTDLGSHPVRDLPRPEQVTQLCHPETQNEFPPLRTAKPARAHNLPAQLTRFVGRRAEMAELRRSLGAHRLVTLTGAGGSGKTRLAVEVAVSVAPEFDDGARYVDLAPITDADAVAATVAQALELPEHPGRSPRDTVLRFVADRRLLLVLDNCEHLLDGCADLTGALLSGCPELTILATSREPIGIAGEVTWRVPSLGLEDEAVDLFCDRAQRARPDFRIDGDDAATAREICRRLDGMPLAIELAAARVRALSLTQILDSLHDRFRLLTGGARTAVRRQQTLRASVDWSYALLTEPERVLFRRLGVFMGGFDLAAAQGVGAGSTVEQYQVLDQLGLLVDKSLVLADDASGAMRYRMLETVRQYALERLGESGEADAVRDRHRDHYTGTAAGLASSPLSADNQRTIDLADADMDNLRAAFTWSRERGEVEDALRLASALQSFWLARGRFREGWEWFDAVLSDEPARGVASAVWVRAVADQGVLSIWAVQPVSLERVRSALATARQLEDPALIVGALNACALLTVMEPETSHPYMDEAVVVAQASGDLRLLCRVRLVQAIAGSFAGDPMSGRGPAEEGRDLADELGDRFMAWNIRVWLGLILYMLGELDEAERVLRPSVAEGAASGERFMSALANIGLAQTLSSRGHLAAARACGETAVVNSTAMGGWAEDTTYVALAMTPLAEGDGPAARKACETSWQHTVPQRVVFIRSINPMAEALLACGEVVAARQWADDTVAIVLGWHKMVALHARARVAIAQGEADQALRDAYEALAICARTRGYLWVAEIVECLATLMVGKGEHQAAVRLFGAADAMRSRIGSARFKVYQASYDDAVGETRTALGANDFEAAYAEGVSLSTKEAISYAQRGRGERRRPSSGWESLTPAELDVIRLVSDGLSNKEIATRQFISPRTVQTHLTHVYTKLGLASRVQLVQEAARHA